MATLQGTLTLDRTVLIEVVEDPNTTPRSVVSGTSASIQAMAGGQTKIDQTDQSGTFRNYGNGNTRLILGSNQTQSQTLALMAITEADIATLKALIGHTVCYRNPNGVKMFGAFLNMQVSRMPGSGGLSNVGLVIQSVTYDEEV